MIGVFGGSGFTKFFDKAEEVEVDTPYGKPSDKISIAELDGIKIAFLPRHGKTHFIPPHAINYRANIWAFKELGVHNVLSPFAAGSLTPKIRPGDFVVCDQFVDFTKGRKDTFYEGAPVTHISSAEPYCHRLRKLAIAACHKTGVKVHETGTVVVIQGPRFSSKAESNHFSSHGWDVINMTQYPEVVLARELEMCYCGIALVTDYDAGIEGHPEIKPVDIKEVIRVFSENNERIKDVLKEMILHMPPKVATGLSADRPQSLPRECGCGNALEGAVIK